MSLASMNSCMGPQGPRLVGLDPTATPWYLATPTGSWQQLPFPPGCGASGTSGDNSLTVLAIAGDTGVGGSPVVTAVDNANNVWRFNVAAQAWFAEGQAPA